MKKFLILVLAAAFLFSAAANVFAVTYKTETVNEVLGTETLYDNFDMWHYSGGYWKIGDNYNSWTWTDAEVGGAMNIGRQLGAKTTAIFQYSYPQAWKDKNGEGVAISLYVSSVSVSIEKLYDLSTYSLLGDNDGFTFTIKPVFNVSSLRTFDDYVSGLRVAIPLIDINYGNNLYSMFKGSSGLGRADGRYWDSSPYGITVGYMHPGFIADKTGKLRSGYTVDTESGRFASDGLAVGTNTLIDGGAVGLLFKFPLRFEMHLEGTRKVPVYTQQELADQEKKRQEEEAARRAAEEEARRIAEEEARREEEERRRQEEERQKQEFIDSLDDARIHRLS